MNLNNLQHCFDAVVMLTWSNWKTELRSNRYHYAKRFAKQLPVIFVQPDLLGDKEWEFEATELDNVTILHLQFLNSNYYHHTEARIAVLNQALLLKKVIRPLLWVYNVYFEFFIANRKFDYVVYHATEDYFSEDAPLYFPPDSLIRDLLLKVLKQTDLLISVSPGVEESYLLKGKYTGDHAVVTNGCDYHFYKLDPNLPIVKKARPIIFYQGNIYSEKLDFQLIYQLVSRNPEWDFWFCGNNLSKEDPDWNRIVKCSNVTYLGTLNPLKLREVMQSVTVGILPFRLLDFLVKRSWPLKSFEYLSCGLPVVSTPIDALEKFNSVFRFATKLEDFETAIRKSIEERYDEKKIQERINLASQQDYDLRFNKAVENILSGVSQSNEKCFASELNILFLYEAKSVQVPLTKLSLDVFKKHSHHTIFFIAAGNDAPCLIDLNNFDAVIIHHSLRFSVDKGLLTLNASFTEAIKHFGGYKALFIQDEYDVTDTTINWICKLGIHLVFTCVPEEYIAKIYPKEKLSLVKFINCLTGYVDEDLNDQNYQDIIASGKYDYHKFVNFVDTHLSQAVRRNRGREEFLTFRIPQNTLMKLPTEALSLIAGFPSPSIIGFSYQPSTKQHFSFKYQLKKLIKRLVLKLCNLKIVIYSYVMIKKSFPRFAKLLSRSYSWVKV